MSQLPPMLFINKLQKYINNMNINDKSDEFIYVRNELNNYMSFHEIVDIGDNTYVMNGLKIYVEVTNYQELNRVYLSKIYVDYLLVACVYFETDTYNTVLHFIEDCCEYSKLLKEVIKYIDVYKHTFYVNYLKYNKIVK